MSLQSLDCIWGRYSCCTKYHWLSTGPAGIWQRGSWWPSRLDNTVFYLSALLSCFGKSTQGWQSGCHKGWCNIIKNYSITLEILREYWIQATKWSRNDRCSWAAGTEVKEKDPQKIEASHQCLIFLQLLRDSLIASRLYGWLLCLENLTSEQRKCFIIWI